MSKNSNKTGKRAILLTGTVVPNSVYTHHTDPKERLGEYIQALEFYTKAFPGDDVFLLENSNYDLDKDPDFAALRKKVNFQVRRYPPSDKFYEGKGYQEFEMLDKAVDELSSLYKRFVKVTGRYIVLNAQELTDHDCKGLTIDVYRRGQKADTFFMYFTGEFYQKHLKGLYKQVNDNESMFIERVLYNKLTGDSLLSHCRLFPRTSILEGRSGSYNINLNRHPLKVLIRNMERSLYGALGVKAFFY